MEPQHMVQLKIPEKMHKEILKRAIADGTGSVAAYVRRLIYADHKKYSAVKSSK